MCLSRGIFWIKDIENLEAVVIKARCDASGIFIEQPERELLSKSEKDFNHKKAWITLPKKITNNKPFDYYPRGRVEIKNGKAIIFANGNIADENLKCWAINEYGLTEENGINSITLIVDMSDHYLCHLDREG